MLLGIGFLITLCGGDFIGVGHLVQGAVFYAVGIGVVVFLVGGCVALIGPGGFGCVPFIGCF